MANGSTPGGSKQFFFGIAQEILGAVSEDAIGSILDHALDQLHYSILRLAFDLENYMGFSHKYAVVTASQIAPKPILYSILVQLRTLGLDKAIERLSGPETRQESFHERLYIQTAPEITAFLLDQIIDKYNMGYAEENGVQELIDRAAVELPQNPDFYHQRLSKLLNDWLDEKPETVAAFSLMQRYVQQYSETNSAELKDVLHTVADALTNGHLAQIAYNSGHYAPNFFRRYRDFVDNSVENGASTKADDAEHTVARTILRGQGFLMVSASQYLIRSFDYPRQASMRDLVRQNPALIKLIRLLESIVRLYDDMGDLHLDVVTQAPNIFLSSDRVKKEFLTLAGIGTGAFDQTCESHIIEAIIAKGQHRQLVTSLASLEAIAYQRVLDENLHLAPFVEIIKNVVYGSQINAIYNDKIAEEIGNSLGLEVSAT